MKIRMTTGLSGPDFTLSPGDERDFGDDEAVRLIAAGFAVPVTDKEMETTVSVPAPERRGRGRR